MNERDFVFRPIEPPVDLPRLVRLMAEVEAVDRTGEDVGEEVLRSFMNVPGHDPGRDRWAVEDPENPDRLIAHSLLLKASTGDEADVAGAVHPGWRRRGIGGELLRRTITRARALNVRHLTVYTDHRNQEAAMFVLRHGFQPVAAYTEMSATTDAPLPSCDVPAGFLLRSYDTLRDLPTLVRAMNRSYEGLWGHHQVTKEALLSFLPDLPEDGIFLAFDPDGEVAGISRVEIKRSPGASGTAGYVDSPGLVPEWRGNQSSRAALLLSPVRWLRDRGYTSIGLESWGDDESTLNLYGTYGFKTVRRDITYAMEL